MSTTSADAIDQFDVRRPSCMRCGRGQPVRDAAGDMVPYAGHLVLLLISDPGDPVERFTCARCWLGEDALDDKHPRLVGVAEIPPREPVRDSANVPTTARHRTTPRAPQAKTTTTKKRSPR